MARPSDEQVLLDLLAADALRSLLVEPRRMRDRAADILAEEADLAAHARQDVGRRRRRRDAVPALHLPFDRLLPHRRAGVDGRRPRPRAPTSPRSPPPAGTRSSATASRSSRQLEHLLADGYRVVVGADGAGSAGRLVHAARRARASHFAARRRRRPPT